MHVQLNPTYSKSELFELLSYSSFSPWSLELPLWNSYNLPPFIRTSVIRTPRLFEPYSPPSRKRPQLFELFKRLLALKCKTRKNIYFFVTSWFSLSTIFCLSRRSIPHFTPGFIKRWSLALVMRQMRMKRMMTENNRSNEPVKPLRREMFATVE